MIKKISQSKPKNKSNPKQKYKSYKKLSYSIASLILKFYPRHKNSKKTCNCGNRILFNVKEFEKKKVYKVFLGCFCQKRLCAYCIYRKAVKRAFYFYKNFPDITEKNLYLITLTFPFHTIFKLSLVRALASSSWNRFRKYPTFKSFLGFIKVFEITMGKNSNKWQAHFHIHILVEVEKDFKKDKKQLLLDWQKATRLGNKVKQVNIKKADENSIKELLKYELKFTDFFRKRMTEKERVKWLLEYEKGVKRLRNIACGGTFKGAIKKPNNLCDDEEEHYKSYGKLLNEWWELVGFIPQQKKFFEKKYEVEPTDLIESMQEQKFL